MNYSRYKPNSVSLKSALESTKFKLKFKKTQKKNLASSTSCSLINHSLASKQKEANQRKIKLTNCSTEQSELHSFDQKSDKVLDPFNCYLYPSTNANFEKTTQVNENFCKKCGESSEGLITQEIRALRSEVLHLRRAFKDIKNSLELQREKRESNFDFDIEDRRNGYTRQHGRNKTLFKISEF